jgi:hypothetical protein
VNLYRCFVNECDSLADSKYDEEWVKDVLPGSISESYGHFVPETCKKYVYNNSLSGDSGNQSCAAHFFEHKEETCNKWVFDKGERTIVNDVSL